MTHAARLMPSVGPSGGNPGVAGAPCPGPWLSFLPPQHRQPGPTSPSLSAIFPLRCPAPLWWPRRLGGSPSSCVHCPGRRTRPARCSSRHPRSVTATGQPSPAYFSTVSGAKFRLPWHRRSSYEPDAPARGVPQSPRWRVGLVCAKDAKLSCRGKILNFQVGLGYQPPGHPNVHLFVGYVNEFWWQVATNSTLEGSPQSKFGFFDNQGVVLQAAVDF